jgi:hypothetical protein
MSRKRKISTKNESKKKSDLLQGRILVPSTWSKSTIDFALSDDDVGIPAKEIRGGSANFSVSSAEEFKNLLEDDNLLEDKKERTLRLDREKKDVMRHLAQFARVIINDHLEVIWPYIPEILARMTERFIPTVQQYLLESVTASGLVDINIAKMYCHSNIVIPIIVDTASFSTTHDSLMTISIDPEEYGIQGRKVFPVNRSNTPMDFVLPNGKEEEEDCLKGAEICAGSSFFCTVNTL